MADDDQGRDPELDAAILAHDQVRTGYILQNRAVRRRMGVACFLFWLVGNCVMLVAGLTSDDIARRIAALASVIGTVEMAAASIIAMYWGAGAFDNRSMMGGGMYGGGMGGGYGGGYGMSGGFGASPLGGLPAPGARLTKTPK